MEVKDDIKQDLESSESCVNSFGFPFEDASVSFFPYEINHYAQRNPSHMCLHAFLLRMQTTKSTMQGAHALAHPQPGFCHSPQVTWPSTYKEQMLVRLLLLPTKHIGGINRNKPQPITSTELAQGSQP